MLYITPFIHSFILPFMIITLLSNFYIIFKCQNLFETLISSLPRISPLFDNINDNNSTYKNLMLIV